MLRWRMRRVTASARALPDFIVIGAPRSGTTTLYQALSEHPDVVAARAQEVHFFNRTPTYQRSLRYYRAFFPLETSLRRRGALTGEGTSVYMYRPNTAERIASDLPDVKLIAVLRDPVERAIASWRAATDRGEETRPLVVALADELGRLGPGDRTPPPPAEVAEGEHDPAHVQKGRYADQLRRWMRLFDETRLLTILSEDLFSDPGPTLDQVFDFLGLPSRATELSPAQPNGVGEELDQAREMLRDYFAKPDRDLAVLLGRSLPWR
jgi:hypothetical protein